MAKITFKYFPVETHKENMGTSLLSRRLSPASSLSLKGTRQPSSWDRPLVDDPLPVCLPPLAVIYNQVLRTRVIVSMVFGELSHSGCLPWHTAVGFSERE